MIETTQHTWTSDVNVYNVSTSNHKRFQKDEAGSCTFISSAASYPAERYWFSILRDGSKSR